jgi:tetratricopeptide (TPR) repeat protein
MALATLRYIRNPLTYEGVRDASERSVRFGPRNAEAYHLYGVKLYRVGDDSGAARMLRRALELDPERPITLANLSILYRHGRQPREALRWADSALGFQPEAGFFYAYRAWARLELGDTAGARRDALEGARRDNSESAETVLILVDLKAGDTVAVRARVAKLGTPPPQYLAAIKDVDGLVTRFRSRDEPPYRLWWLLRAPEYDPIRTDPRFQRLWEEVRVVERQ